MPRHDQGTVGGGRGSARSGHPEHEDDTSAASVLFLETVAMPTPTPTPTPTTLAAATALAVAGASYYYYHYVWRSRKRQQPCVIQVALETAEQSVPFSESSPIYNSLNRGQPHASSCLRVQYHTPETFEALDVRLFQRDVAKGCIDPDVLGTDAGRDWASVEVLCGGEWRRLRLPAFLAHLANPLAMFEPEIDEATIIPLYEDGTFTGTLVW